MKRKAKHMALGLVLATTLIAAWFAPPAKNEGVVLTDRAQNTTTSDLKINAGQINNSVGVSNTAPTQTLQGRDANGVGGNSARDSSGNVSKAPVEVLSIRPRKSNLVANDQDAKLFSPTQWREAVAAPKAIVAVAPPPQAPPLPFRFLGRYDDAGKTAVFLQHFEHNLVARVGDTLAEQYKVESLEGSTLTLRYLPLNQIQTLEVGGAQ